MLNYEDVIQEGIELITQIKKETELLLTEQEACIIYLLIKSVEKIDGDIAEVGVYKGGSAKIICEATKKPVHLFDTFEGLPEISNRDKSFQKGTYLASLDAVKNYLSNYSNLYFYKGIFPATAEPIKNKRFSFVHLDVDLYKSTLDCLQFFYPRMNKGGVIISHDYLTSEGVREAVDEFFKDKLEIIILPATWQCLIVKL